MTRDEFLDQFLERAGLSKRYRTPDGVRIGSFHRIAVPCSAGDGEHFHYGSAEIAWKCQGWILEPPPVERGFRGGEYSVTDHRKTN